MGRLGIKNLAGSGYGMLLHVSLLQIGPDSFVFILGKPPSIMLQLWHRWLFGWRYHYMGERFYADATTPTQDQTTH